MRDGGVTSVMDLNILVSVRTRIVKQLPAHWDTAPGLGAAPATTKIFQTTEIKIFPEINICKSRPSPINMQDDWVVRTDRSQGLAGGGRNRLITSKTCINPNTGGVKPTDHQAMNYHQD